MVARRAPSETASKPKSPRDPKAREERKEHPRERGSVLGLVRSAVSHQSKLFTVREVTDIVSAKTKKAMMPSGVRQALNLLVNTGEVKIAHEGTGRTDPTTWQATARGRKGDGEAEA